MPWFLPRDFTAVLSALSKFFSLQGRITDGSSSRAGATPESDDRNEADLWRLRAAQTGVAPALELFCSPCFSKHRSSATRCIVTSEAGHNGVQTRIFVRTLLSTEIIRPLRTVTPWGVDRRTCSRGRAIRRSGPIQCLDLALYKARPCLRAPLYFISSSCSGP
jgi:hypothetical protein